MTVRANPQTDSTTRYVRSFTDPNHFYLVVLNSRGFWECECKAAQFNRRAPCKHVKVVAKEDVGLIAMPKVAPAPSFTRARTSAEGLAFAASLDL
jgi:hypothetical protein